MISELNEKQEKYMKKAIQYLRVFLRDDENYNVLLNARESSDEELEFAILMTISDYNSTEPYLDPVHIDTYPSFSLLMTGASIYALKSAGLIQKRNGLQYQVANSSFQRFGKGNEYLNWVQNLLQEYESKMRSYKVSKNVSQAMGMKGVHSEYLM